MHWFLGVSTVLLKITKHLNAFYIVFPLGMKHDLLT